MGRENQIVHETWGPYTSAAAADTTTVRDTKTAIGGISLLHFDELIVEVDVSAAPTGGPLDVYLQYAARPDPDPTDDTDWSDYSHCPQFVAGSTAKRMGWHPMQNAPNAAVSTDVWRDKENGALVQDAAVTGHWGDRLRILEKMGALVSGAATYSIHVTGIIRG